MIAQQLRSSYLKMQFANTYRAPSESHRSLMILPQIAGAISTDNPNSAGITNGMEYRGVEYSVVQGVERGKWVWSLALDTNAKKLGLVGSKPAAVIVAERAIDRALDPRRLEPSNSLNPSAAQVA
jgi:hypothetical protein